MSSNPQTSDPGELPGDVPVVVEDAGFDEAWWQDATGIDAADRALDQLAVAAPAVWSIGELTAMDPGALAPDDAVTYLVALQRHAAWLASLEARALVAAAGAHTQVMEHRMRDSRDHREGRPGRLVKIVDPVREEIAAALHSSASTVQASIDRARLLSGPLRATRDALAAGDLGPAQARVIAQQAERMTGADLTVAQAPHADTAEQAEQRARYADRCTRLQSRILGRACERTPAETASLARRAIVQIDADGAAERRARARAGIDVWVSGQDDGLAVLCARMDALAAARAHALISAHAQASVQLPRRTEAADAGLTAGQARAAALMALLESGSSGLSATSPAPAVAVTPVAVNVTIDLPTLLALTDRPAELSAPGLGDDDPIDITALRALIADPTCPVTLRRLVHDPVTGHLLDHGRRTYTVTGPLRAYLTARDRTCRFPGCRRAATRCQIDHAVPWDSGGLTDTANLGALCLRHHQMKTHADWQITDSRPDGTCTWQSPQHRTHHHDPPPV